MPRQVLKVTRSNTLSRRPKQKLRVGTSRSFVGHNSARRLGVWMRAKLVPLLGLAALLWIIMYLVSSPEYRITNFAIKGNSLIPAEQLMQLSGLQNQPLLLASGRVAEESIAKLKAVKTASVRLQFPNQAIIEIAERPGAYIWKVKDTLFLVSDDGIVVGTTPTVNQPVALVDIEAKDVAIGDAVDSNALETASALRGQLPRAISLTPSYFEYSRAEGVVLPTDFAGRVVFGNSDDLENKVATLKSMKQIIEEQKLVVKYLDLRFQDKPYFR